MLTHGIVGNGLDRSLFVAWDVVRDYGKTAGALPPHPCPRDASLGNPITYSYLRKLRGFVMRFFVQVNYIFL
jgi:hypothetical protein